MNFIQQTLVHTVHGYIDYIIYSLYIFYYAAVTDKYIDYTLRSFSEIKISGKDASINVNWTTSSAI